MDNKVKQNGYGQFFDFEKDMRSLVSQYHERLPQGPRKLAVLQEYTQKIYSDGAMQFIRNIAADRDAFKDNFE